MIMKCASISTCECRVCSSDRTFSIAFVNTTSLQPVKLRISRESYMEFYRMKHSRRSRTQVLITMSRRILNRTRDVRLTHLRRFLRGRTPLGLMAVRHPKEVRVAPSSKKAIKVPGRLIAPPLQLNSPRSSHPMPLNHRA